jgi:hypothetical protein
MRLERAEQFSERSPMTRRELKTFQAAMSAGMKCCKCSARATNRVGDGYYCSLDAQVERNRLRRAKFGHHSR